MKRQFKATVWQESEWFVAQCLDKLCALMEVSDGAEALLPGQPRPGYRSDLLVQAADLPA